MRETEIQTARPRPLSFDGIYALVGAVLAGSGISTLIGFAWGLSVTTAIVFVAVGLPMLFVQRRLGYTIEGRTLRVDVLTGSRSLELGTVKGVHLVDGWLLGMPLPAYHTGPAVLVGHGLVKAYASCVSGPFVLLERDGERPWLVSPHEAEGFIEQVRAKAPIAQA